ncbi:MAG: PASTA domain-containing protein [Fimbriimonadaceae bacterium]|nr:PASTA domain-containing protein [Fimbriimonadaceae bacterium]
MRPAARTGGSSQPSGPRRLKFRYELQTQLAEGPVLDTWRAVDKVHESPVIVKLLRPRYATDERAARRWTQLLAKQASAPLPASVAILETGRDQEQFFLVRDYAAGPTLERWMERPRSVDDVLACGIALLDAVAEWHELGHCHGQLHPGNIVLQEQGPWFCDWDITAQTLNCLGVWAARRKHQVYLAPEVRESYNASPGSDVYSIGVALWEQLTGRRLAPETVPEAPSRLKAALPAGLDVVLEGMLKRDPHDRYPAAQAADALAKLRPQAESERGGSPRERRRQRVRDRREVPLKPLPWPITVLLVGYRFLFILLFTAAVSGTTLAVLGVGAYRVLVDSIPAEVIVPDVTGKKVDDARGLFVDSLGLGFTVTLRQASPTVPEGCIVSTRPEAGRKVRAGRTVEAIVSTGAELVTVPRLTDQSLGDAERTIERLGLRLGFAQKVADDALPPGYVIKQDPGPGRKVASGSAINLKVSSGPPSATPAEPGKAAVTEPGKAAPPGDAAAKAAVKVKKVGRVRITVPSSPRLTWVKIVVRDDEGEKVAYNELKYAGDSVLKTVEGVGQNVVVEVYLNGTRVETKVL